MPAARVGRHTQPSAGTHPCAVMHHRKDCRLARKEACKGGACIPLTCAHAVNACTCRQASTHACRWVAKARGRCAAGRLPPVAGRRRRGVRMRPRRWGRTRARGMCLHQASRRRRVASCMSLGMMVTRLAWMAVTLTSSMRPTCIVPNEGEGGGTARGGGGGHRGHARRTPQRRRHRSARQQQCTQRRARLANLPCAPLAVASCLRAPRSLPPLPPARPTRTRPHACNHMRGIRPIRSAPATARHDCGRPMPHAPRTPRPPPGEPRERPAAA